MTELRTHAGPIRYGSTLVYASFSGTRRCMVTEVMQDVKNGRPGFDAELPNGDRVWGYADQVVTVVHY